MSYKETPHPHQSDLLRFVPNNYEPYKKDEGGIKTFGVIEFENNTYKIKYQHKLPTYGGYISSDENIFGNPTYCPNATRHHIRHLEKYGSMPHLVFFNSEETAKKAGFRKCKICTKRK